MVELAIPIWPIIVFDMFLIRNRDRPYRYGYGGVVVDGGTYLLLGLLLDCFVQNLKTLSG